VHQVIDDDHDNHVVHYSQADRGLGLGQLNDNKCVVLTEAD